MRFNTLKGVEVDLVPGEPSNLRWCQAPAVTTQASCQMRRGTATGEAESLGVCKRIISGGTLLYKSTQQRLPSGL